MAGVTDTSGVVGELVIDRSVPLAPYYQLREGLRRKIKSGSLRPGDRLPPMHAMAGILDVGISTVKRAVSGLAQEGLLISRTRQGTVVAEQPVPAMQVIVPQHAGECGPLRAFLDQIIAGVNAGSGGGSGRRCVLTYVDETHASAREILAMCRAVHADGLMVYQPSGPIVNALREVAARTATVSLGEVVAGAAVDAVLADPRRVLRQELLARLGQGRRDFVYVGRLTNEEAVRQETSCYARLYHTFVGVMAEARIEARLIVAPSFEELEPFEGRLDLADGAVMVSCSPHVAHRMASAARDVDIIAQTQCALSVETFRGEMTFLYTGLEVCAERGLALIQERNRDGLQRPARVVRMEPVVVRRGCEAAASRKGGISVAKGLGETGGA